MHKPDCDGNFINSIGFWLTHVEVGTSKQDRLFQCQDNVTNWSVLSDVLAMVFQW